MAMNTSGCCELKMVWNVGTRKNSPGSAAAYTAIMASQTPITA
jgi:hypothetical protein